MWEGLLVQAKCIATALSATFVISCIVKRTLVQERPVVLYESAALPTFWIVDPPARSHEQINGATVSFYERLCIVISLAVLAIVKVRAYIAKC